MSFCSKFPTTRTFFCNFACIHYNRC